MKILDYLIKNETPYLGKIKLKIEKYPNYTGGTCGKLNKIHLDLGFTKIVSRLIPNKTLTGWEVDLGKINLINKYTDGRIVQRVSDKLEDLALPNSFVSKTGKYIGDINTAWWYFNNGMTVCADYPHGVALKWKTTLSDKTLISGHAGLLGYYGYTHRGGCLFSIGDRIFDETYKPIAADYDEAEWQEWQTEFDRKLTEADDFDRKWLEEDGISCVMPFRKRGSAVIVDWQQARQAAINLSKHLS
jgi:hypothetical protein